MYTICTTEESAARQRELENRLLQKMRTRHLDKITVEELCEPSGISRRAFYHYFSGKEDALAAKLDHTLQDYEAFECPAGPGLPHTLREVLRFVLYWRQQGPLLDALQYNGLEHLLVDRVLELLRREEHNLREPLRRIASDCRDLQQAFLAEGIFAVIFGWHRRSFAQPPEQIAALLHAMLLEPLFSPSFSGLL